MGYAPFFGMAVATVSPRRSRSLFRLSRNARISTCTGPVRYASRSSRTRSPTNTNDTRRRSFFSIRSSVQPTADEERREEQIVRDNVSGGFCWKVFFRHLCASFGALVRRPLVFLSCNGSERVAFVISDKNLASDFFDYSKDTICEL